MKPASPALIAYLKSNLLLYYVDLWTFTLANGVVLRYCAGDLKVTIGGHTYVQNDVLVGGGARVSNSVGLQVNEADLRLLPGPSSMIGNVPFFQGVQAGLLDRAAVQEDRLFMPSWGDTSLGSVPVFNGQVTDIQITRTDVQLKCKDIVNLLNIYMPRRQYQATCSFVFGDTNCGFDRSTIAVSTSAGAGSSGSIINCALTDTAGKYNNGTVKATTGPNAGISRSVKNYQPGVIQLVAPFPTAFGIGDALTVTPGCTKNFSGPSQQFQGSTANGSTPTSIITNLTNAAGFFNGGNIQFTSGPNIGNVRTISLWTPGMAVMSSAFPSQPNTPATTGQTDTFIISSVSTNTAGSCSGYFGSDADLHFGGQPYVPVPETAY